jgi:hypothetical protein
MEPVNPLGPALRHAGHQYELWLRREEWHLYRGEPSGTSFRFFIIMKADRKPGPDKSADYFWLKKAREDVNVCGPFFANVWVTRDKFGPKRLTKDGPTSWSYR